MILNEPSYKHPGDVRGEDYSADEVVYETEETSIVDVPVEDNYYPFVQIPD
jgi:hypothetical protein